MRPARSAAGRGRAERPPRADPSLDIPTGDVARGLLFRMLVLGLLHDAGERDALVNQARWHTRAAHVLGL
ncbi:hypothetical protein [Serinicoccus sp. CUA-874]|uniref:hypothetical protein n=1 Tax=Serinicoccus sp. CUA-874 TaxID=1517939 RepID=UPI00117B2DB8|nr:hypothetical protein [Serinicoccus sp. CUA-874]